MALRPPDQVDGDGIRLRRMSARDAADIAVAVAASGPELRRYETWAEDGFTAADGLAYVVWWERAWEEGTAFYYAIEGEDGTFYGSAGLGQVDHESGSSAVGYWIRSDAAGRGIATAALRALVAAAHAAGFVELTAVIAESNLASRRVAEKAGGVRREPFGGTVPADGGPVPAVEYVLEG